MTNRELDHPCSGACARAGGAVTLNGRLIDRRMFLAQTTVAAITAALAACGDGQFGSTAPVSLSVGAGGAGLRVPLASFPALATVGSVARVDGGVGTPVAVVRTGAATFSAFSLVCPHQGTTVNVQSTGFTCPNHGARFSLAGVWQGGQPTSDLVSLTTTYDAATQTLTIGGAGAGTGTPTTAATPTPAGFAGLVVRVASFAALGKIGGVARVDGGTGTPVALVRTGSSSFAAFSLVCPHAGTTVNITSAGFTCPNHGARFGVDGKWLGGQSTTNLVSLAATYDAAAGTVAVSTPGASAPRPGGDDDDGRHGDGHGR